MNDLKPNTAIRVKTGDRRTCEMFIYGILAGWIGIVYGVMLATMITSTL